VENILRVFDLYMVTGCCDESIIFIHFLTWCYSHYLCGLMCPTVPPPPKAADSGAPRMFALLFHLKTSRHPRNILMKCSEFLPLQVSALYTYPEPSNHCLKTQKHFARSFPVPDTGRNLSNNCCALNVDCLYQDRLRESKLVW
jgi:hypothetical protein